MEEVKANGPVGQFDRRRMVPRCASPAGAGAGDVHGQPADHLVGHNFGQPLERRLLGGDGRILRGNDVDSGIGPGGGVEYDSRSRIVDEA
jgi:hypothetical protein